MTARALTYGLAPTRPAVFRRPRPARAITLPRWLLRLLGFRQDPPAAEIGDGPGLGLFPVLVLWLGLALLGVAFADNAGIAGQGWAEALFWPSIAAMVLPATARIVSSRASERERAAIAIALGMALFLVRLLHNPLAFTDNDELMHWRSALDLMQQKHLFVPNPLLPISPDYPALELAATAIANLSGLPLFVAGMIVIGTSRFVFVASAYALFRKISGSSRVAGVGAVIAMASSTFVFFESQFSYESIAQAIAMLGFCVAIDLVESWRALAIRLPLWIVLSASLALSHHLTSYFAAAVLLLVSLSYLAVGRDWARALRMLVLALITIAAIGIWQDLVGNPTGGYLVPALVGGFTQILAVLLSGAERHLFASGAGASLPAWEQADVLAALALTGLGLSTGFFRILAAPRPDERLLEADILRDRAPWGAAFAVLSAGYPFCVLLRLSSGSWEIGNRLGSYLFIAVAYVIAIAVHGFWQGRSASPIRAVLIAAAVTVLVFGGMISGYAPLILPGPYLVGADSRSIEPHGIDAAEWTKDHLGPGNTFAADRINRLLLADYGDQRVVTSLYDRIDESPIFFAPRFGDEVRGLIKALHVDYLLVDWRLTQALPLVGWYYELEEGDENHAQPIKPQSFRKFDTAPGISRVFDSGSIAIYDTRRVK
ncbi:MAG TPA: hypothetical protein VHB74_10445 [Devosia sp.]|nr:hypothetical protein [Devosia sp.]